MKQKKLNLGKTLKPPINKNLSSDGTSDEDTCSNEEDIGSDISDDEESEDLDNIESDEMDSDEEEQLDNGKGKWNVQDSDEDDEEFLKKTDAQLSGDDSDDEWLNADVEHKRSLGNLKKIDPEFYQYLQENDKKLLDFNASDESEVEDEDDEKFHRPPDELEIGSEESDYEAEEGVKRSDKAVTLAFVKKCREELINNPSVKNITLATDLFHAALDRVVGEDTSQYTVEGSAVFNAVIEMCVMHLNKSVADYLKLPKHAKDPSKCKKWIKIKSLLQTYFADLLKILSGVASEHIVSVLLKHLHSFCGYVACYQKLSKTAIKHLTKLWSTGEESVRVLAFLCILRLTTVVQKSSLLNSALKLMYISFVKGSKFVSATTLPQINFMKQTLVTLFTINPSLSYQHAFLYIRQLAIHLRNAITIHKKETFQTVYNWQYVNSLRLWIDLLCSSQESSELQQLTYPLIQIILGCIRLIPTAQYLPLRFHCTKMLIKIGNELGIYVPVLPLILEGLMCADLNKRLKKASIKPFDFTFVLRLSKTTMTETGFTDAVIENVFEQLLELTTSYSHNIAYSDLVVPAIFQLKSIIKELKTPKYSSKLKQALIKIEENFKFINSERNKFNINLNDTNKIKAYELDIKAKGTPLQKYWEQYKKSQNLIKTKRIAEENAKNCDIGLPKIKRQKLVKKVMKKENGGPLELFPSDDDESDEEVPQLVNLPSTEKKDKKKNNKKLKATVEIKSEEEDDDEQEDLVEELNLNNF